MKSQYFAEDPRETERYHSPAPASYQGKWLTVNELLWSLNEDGEWEENECTRSVDAIPDEEDREEKLIDQIDRDNDEYYTRADEAEINSKTLLPRSNRVHNGKAPSDATPAVEDDLYAVMSSDDPKLDEYQGYVLKEGAREEWEILMEESFDGESILSTPESRKRITKKQGEDRGDYPFRFPKFYQAKKEKQKTRIEKTTTTFDEPISIEYLDTLVEDEDLLENTEKSPTLKSTIRSNRDRKHGRGRKSDRYIDGKDHPNRSERRDAHMQEHEIVKQYKSAA